MNMMWLYRTVLCPVDFDGRIIKDLKDAYKTNELGFFIAASFFGALSWSFLKYRRNSILA